MIEIPDEEYPPLPDFRLDGRDALITGASSGIGAACARALASAGARVTLVARARDKLERLAERIESDGGSARVAPCDVLDTEGFARVVDAMPGLHIMLNNAGSNRPAPFLEVTHTDFDAVVDINLRAAFFCAQAAARRMVAAAEGGSIINMSSQMGKVGGRRRTVYCATKHATEGLTRAMALDLAEYNIRVNSVCPTYIETPMTRPFLADDDFRNETLVKIPLGRLGQVGDIAGTVVFLAGDAAALMTGSSLVVDGGWTAQ
ncbi:MAG: NAD(P)-dependent dehydrogenase (short-subunit alcohol dehydrogenase family) [Halieaceae bacterium]|jgi:NAD(P)-dependent dehydrogenase (short-subunit alcohol dehydrogenase family)